jgi:hypothetical protein
MPKFMWVFIAGAFIGERWGWWGMLGIVVAELSSYYVSGLYEAWKADRKPL